MVNINDLQEDENKSSKRESVLDKHWRDISTDINRLHELELDNKLFKKNLIKNIFGK